jgi:hypothetical protein
VNVGVLAQAMKVVIALIAITLIAGCASVPEATNPVRFVVLGDAPYNATEEAKMGRLIGSLVGTPHDFVVHVGDIKAGTEERCDDSLYAARYELFRQSSQPFVLLAGDNDWADCRRAGAGAFAPLERLERLRQVFFARANNLARALQPTQHDTLPELMHWRLQGVEFVSLHVVGSRDNQGFDAAGDREQAERMAANLAWLSAAAARAEGNAARALVVMFHVNPVFERPPPVYQALIAALVDMARASPRPMLLIHGDTHTYQFDQALINPVTGKPFSHVWRIESFGNPDVGAVHVSIAENPVRFSVEPVTVGVDP